MFHIIRHLSRISHTPISSQTEHIVYRHPFSLVLLSILVVGQSGLCSAFAATLPVATVSKQNYVYIQSSPTTDDAWIGTQVSPSLPTPNISLSVPTGVSQSIDTSWIGNGIKKKNITSGKPNLSAVPSTPIPSPATYSSFAIQYTTPNGTLLNNISSPNSVVSYVPPVLSVFGRNGTILGQSGDYVTTLVTEGTNLYYTQARFDAAFGLKTTSNLIEGANLYFTNLRAQNALSGTLATITTDIATATGDISTLSGQVAALQGLSHDAVTLGSANGLSLSVQQISLALANSTTTGALSMIDWNTFNNKLNLNSLTTTGGFLSYNNITGQFGSDFSAFVANGLSLGVDGKIKLGGTLSTGTTIDQNGFDILYNNGRVGFGATSLSSQYQFGNTFTSYDSNFNVNGTSATVAAFNGGVEVYKGNAGAADLWLSDDASYAGGYGRVSYAGGNVSLSNYGGGDFENQIRLNGAGASSNITFNTAGNYQNHKMILDANGNLGIGTNIVPTAKLDVSGDIKITDGTQGLGKVLTSDANGLASWMNLLIGSATSTGALSMIDWNTFNNKESALTFATGVTRVGNTVGLTNTGITFLVGLSGTDMNWSTAFTALGGTATLNIPDASTTTRGLVSTGSQVFAGAKTFATAPTLSGFTLGSALFVSTGGLLAQDNSNFFWDNTNKRLGIGMVTPNAKLEINSGIAGTGGLRFTQLTSASIGTSNNGKVLSVDGSGNIILTNASTAGVDVIAVKTTAATLAAATQTGIYNSITQNINNAYSGTTGIFTVPVSDTYTIEAQYAVTMPIALAATPCLAIRRAAVIVIQNCNSDYNDTGGGTANQNSVSVSATMTLTAGQIVDTQFFTLAGGTTQPTFLTTAGTNYLVIKRVGNAALTTSDARLKQNILAFTGGLDEILGVNTVTFQYNGMAAGAQNDGETHVGIIAQDMQKNGLGKYAVKQGFDGYLRYDPTAVLYALVNSIKTLDAKKANTGSVIDFVSTLSGVTNSITTFSHDIQSISSEITFLQSRFDTFVSPVPVINNYTTLVQTGSVSVDYEISSADQSIFSAITATIDSILMKVQTTFAEMVIFMKSVVFQSVVIFQDRVTFEDHDMAGTAVIRSGAHSVRIDFNRAYTVTPRVTVTADAFVTYRVTAKGVTGFTIETQSPVSSDTSFDWIALQVVGAHISDSTTTPPVVVSETIPEPIVISGSTGSTPPVATPVELMSTTDSGAVAPVGTPISTTDSGSMTTVSAPIVDTPTVTDTPVAPTEPIVPIDIP